MAADVHLSPAHVLTAALSFATFWEYQLLSMTSYTVCAINMCCIKISLSESRRVFCPVCTWSLWHVSHLLFFFLQDCIPADVSPSLLKPSAWTLLGGWGGALVSLMEFWQLWNTLGEIRRNGSFRLLNLRFIMYSMPLFHIFSRKLKFNLFNSIVWQIFKEHLYVSMAPV